MRQHQHSHVHLKGCLKFFGFDQFELVAALFAQRFCNVEIGWKVGALTQNDVFLGVVRLGNGQGRAEDFEQVDGGTVGRHHFIVFGANQFGNFVADFEGQLKPTCSVPAFDQVSAPFLRYRLRNARWRGFRQNTQ